MILYNNPLHVTYIADLLNDARTLHLQWKYVEIFGRASVSLYAMMLFRVDKCL